MTIAGGSDEDEPAELRRCLRDVLGLLALPAVWRSRAPDAVLSSFAEALDSTVHADLVLACARAGDSTIDTLRIRGVEAGARVDEASAWFKALAGRASSAVVTVACGGGLGELTAVYEPIAYAAASGHVIVASRRPGFPTRSEMATIRAATALATTSLETSRAMREREEALRAKDEFLAVLGHELRNPLAPIAGALEIISRRKGGALSREEEVIRRQVHHLGRLVDDLLDVARITRGTMTLEPAPLELADVVAAAVEATAEVVRAKRHALSVDVPRGAIVHGDPFRLTQVLTNLLTNAARYTPDGGHLAVTATVRDATVEVEVEDDGIGIAPDLLPRVFDAFVQGRRRSDPQYGGLGIGLALVRTIVALHGGSVEVTSDGPGRGSRFKVALPRVVTAPVGADQEATPAAPPASPRRRIVVVDDNVDAGEMLAEALALAGHEVRVLHDPVATVAVVEDLGAEIVVLDLGMPVLDGYGVAAALRERLGSRCPALVALTGYGQASDRASTTSAGFVAHFVKPVDLDRLLEHVATLRSA